MDAARKILEIAKWAPSGDNTQPWRFEIASPHHLVVRAFDTRRHVIYDLEGHASHIAHGALLQTIIYAATSFGIEAKWTLRTESSEEQPVYDVHLNEEPSIEKHPLTAYIESRATQRRPMSPTSLSETEKVSLENAAGDDFEIRWWSSWRDRFKFAKFLFSAARLRLITPEAFEVHRQIIEWGASDSVDKIPETAVGMSPLTLRLSQWTFQSWKRMAMMNAIPTATWFPRLELDFFPGLFCASHYALFAKNGLQTSLDYVSAGMAVQRVWLQATALGLQQQPEMTPLIFKTYINKGIEHTADHDASAAARKFATDGFWSQFSEGEVERMCWVGRLGRRKVKTRSSRLPLERLLQSQQKSMHYEDSNAE